MTREEFERLVRVEERLESIRADLVEHRQESDGRLKELRDMVEKIGIKIDATQLHWSAIVNDKTVRIVLYAVLSLGGAGAAAKALLTP